MKIISLISISTFALLLFTQISCKKEETITNGTVVFWNLKDSKLGEVTVTMADGTKGVITLDYLQAPTCDNAKGCFTYTAKQGTYSYKAEETDNNFDGLPDHVWSGSIEITSNGCSSLRLATN